MDRPIIFSGPMVRALLDGRKTQTRRLLSPALQALAREPAWEAVKGADGIWRLLADTPDVGGSITCCERYADGDRLYVREAHALLPRTAYRASVGTGTIDQREHPTDGYSAAVFREGFDRSGRPRWRPSIHMPRWASRLTLVVTEVRVERLNDISEADARAEGLACLTKDDGRTWKYGLADRDGWPGTDDDGWPWSDWSADPRRAFATLWNRIHGPHAWAANPWIVAVTFTVHRTNIDALPPVARAA